MDASDFRRDMTIDWDTLLGPALRTPHYRQRTHLRLDQGQVSAEWEKKLSDGGSLNLRLAMDGNREDYRFREQGQDEAQQDNLFDRTDAKLHVLGGTTRVKWTLPAWGRHTLQVGAEAAWTRGVNPECSNCILPPANHRRSATSPSMRG